MVLRMRIEYHCFDNLIPFRKEVGDEGQQSGMASSKTQYLLTGGPKYGALLLFLQQQMSNKQENKMSQQPFSEDQDAANELYSPHDDLQSLHRSSKSAKKQLAKKPTLETIDRIIEAKKASNYYWTNTQNKRYANFLAEFGHLFEMTSRQRRQKKINLLMSKRVRTRNPVQCHSHHQKMIKKYGSLAEIIKNLQGESEAIVKLEEFNSTMTFMAIEPSCSQKWMKQQESVKEVQVSGIILELPSNCISIDYFEEVNNDYEYSMEKLLEWIEW